MIFVLGLLVFLAILFGVVGRRHHNHEFILLSYIFILGAFGVASVLFLAMGAFPGT